MDVLLHSPDALAQIAAEAPEPARSWARALLAVWSPGQSDALPTADLLWDPILAHIEPSPVNIAEACSQGPMTEGLAATLSAATVWGHDLRNVETVLRQALLQATPEAVPWLIQALPDPLTVDDIKQCASCGGTSTQWLAPAAILRLLASRGGDVPTTTQVVAGIKTESMRFATLRALGMSAPGDEPLESVAAAVAAGAKRAGRAPPPAPRVRGSRSRRAMAWGVELLAARTDALSAAILAALATENSPTMTRLLMAEAAWLALFEPSDDPVGDVLSKGGASHAPTMRKARLAATMDDAARLLEHAVAGNVGAAILCLAVNERPPAELWPAAISRATAGSDAPTWEAIACALAPSCHERVPQLIGDPTLRDVGLTVAAWCPTLSVLGALIDAPVPSAPPARRAWAWALACAGDRVAADHIAALAQADPELDLGQSSALAAALGL